MPQSFSYIVTLDESPAAAQARVRQSITEQLNQAAGMRPAPDPDESQMAFVPRWGWPLLAAVARRASGEKVSLRFRETDNGTKVAVSGKVGASRERVAGRDFWERALRRVP
jgi:hypothetical protein